MTAPAKKRGTSTPNFGSSKRESHDASGFYDRFTPPEVSTESEINQSTVINTILHQDARKIDELLPANSVALVVTSPPYFAGKEYEETLGENGVPASYFEYLELLRDVFAACKIVLEPGGRIAVNVANLGRRPYRSLSADITMILQDLGLLMRGEVIWWKGRAAGGSCAWGSFQRPTNPVIRDVTERVIIASKGRFDRALTPKQRLAKGLPSTASISRDEFLEATTDLWELPPASATSVGHPAPFPIELPQRLIELYTYEDDLVLDPFMGAGTTGIAAVRTGRSYVGFETDQAYIDLSHQRIEDERNTITSDGFRVVLPAVKPIQAAETPTTETTDSESDDGQPASEQGHGRLAVAVQEGRQAKALAQILLEESGFNDVRSDIKFPRLGIEFGLVATDQTGQKWAFDVSGGFTTSRSGLKQTDSLWRALGKAAVLNASEESLPLILLTSDKPARRTPGDRAIQAALGPDQPIHDVIELLDPDDQSRLAKYGHSGRG